MKVISISTVNLTLPEQDMKLSGFFVSVEEYIHRYEHVTLSALLWMTVIVLVLLLIALLTKALQLWRRMGRKYVFLEVTPPRNTGVPMVSTANLFDLISGLMGNASCSCEIVSSEENGIRFLS